LLVILTESLELEDHYNRTMSLLLAVLLTLTALFTTGASDVAAIRAARAGQNQAIAAGDAERIASYWTDDVTVRSGLGASVSGRAEYRQKIGSTGLIYVRTPSTIEVSDHWPLAFESGNWTAQRGGVSGPEVMGGRYSAQWVKRDGRWLIRSEVFVALTCNGAGCEAPAMP
jgi:ketosteroid isomerase-like protein